MNNTFISIQQVLYEGLLLVWKLLLIQSIEQRHELAIYQPGLMCFKFRQSIAGRDNKGRDINYHLSNYKG